jgi:hypothetical protein
MSAVREPDQADFDLERFIDMFDEAMTSQDPRVIETLRSLLMIVTLTRPETREEHGRRSGPLRRLFDDVYNLNRNINRMDEDLRNVANELRRAGQPYRWEAEDKYTMTAAAQMAQQIDQDVLLNQLLQQHQVAKQINVGYTLGPENKAKGLK